MLSSQLDKLKNLLETDDIRCLTQNSGGNSKVFCIEAHGQKWAVKSYPPYAPNQRDRLAAECQTYQFLNQEHVPAVPQFKAVSLTERWLIIEWIDGELPSQYTNRDISQAVQFIRHIQGLNSLPQALALPQAAEACLSLNSIFQQIERRFERLSSQTNGDSSLLDFLFYDFMPVFESIRQPSLLLTDSILPFEKRSLIPADFGFHNALRRADGQLVFFDFDYFGWDDPVKLLADILWHPKMNLTLPQQHQFIDGIADIYQADSTFLSRFELTKPLFGLRWVLILLNEFIPDFWQNRQHANAEEDHQAAKMRQLTRAKAMLSAIQHPPR